jgi:CubicO group peptidase (beta-lactamase class C family)
MMDGGDQAALETYLRDGKAIGFAVLHDGALRYEWYGNGGARDQPAAGFSLSKTALALMLARSAAAGELPPLASPVTDLIPELRARDEGFAAITLQDLVDMRSGIGFSEAVNFPWINQDAPAVYYASDLESTVLQRPVIRDVRGTFVYNDYAPNLTGLALQRASGSSLVDGAFAALWRDMGAEYTSGWSVDSKGFAWHESGWIVTVRDLARFGALWLSDPNDVVPDAFAADTLRPDARSLATTFAGTPVGYRDGWWVLPAEDGSEDFAAMGRHGQIIFVSPASGVVIARLGIGGPETNIALVLRMRAAARRMAGLPDAG